MQQLNNNINTRKILQNVLKEEVYESEQREKERAQELWDCINSQEVKKMKEVKMAKDRHKAETIGRKVLEKLLH